MMRQLTPKKMILLGFLLVVAGFCLPFLMMMRMLEPSFLLGFLAYMASLGGLVLGIIGTALYTREWHH